ncbi:MAG: hypothetical protein H7Z14_01430, partial [Anaerolineae bacterium]|nr:hypothetical protein [Phycisphaerae bacterium]
MTKPLTARQSEVLAFIRDYITANAFAPTLEEIREHFGVSKVT